MSLIKALVLRLNSDIPLANKCLFAKEVCDRPGINLSYKESLIVDWLFQELGKSELHRTHDLWRTLHYVFEQACKKNAAKSCMFLRSSFAHVVFEHVDKLSQESRSDTGDLSLEILKCVLSVVLCPPTTQIFLKQPDVLVKVLSKFLIILNRELQLGHESTELLAQYFALIKHVIDSQATLSENCLKEIVEDLLEPVLIFIKLTESDNRLDNKSEKTPSNLLTEWMKTVLCHPRLIQVYKHTLKLDNVELKKKNQVKCVECLFKKVETLMKSNSKLLAAELMSILLQGMLEKQSQNSLDIPFSLLVYCFDLATPDLSVLNQLLKVPARNSALMNRSANITTATKLNWFKQQCNTFLTSDEQITTEITTFLSHLLAVSSSVIDSNLETVWKISWFKSSSRSPDDQANFLCLLLKTYTRLRQIPKLFLKLVTCIKELSLSLANDDLFPRAFIVSFSECVASLPAGQSLELWQSLLDGIRASYLNGNFKLPAIVELFSAFLTHVKTTESEFPSAKQVQLKDLICNTTNLLDLLLRRTSSPEYEVLNLCHAWGEVMLTLKLYRSDSDILNSVVPTGQQRSTHLFDISLLHPYHSAKEWTEHLSRIDTSDENLRNSLGSLLIQKARAGPILCNLYDADEVKDIIAPVSHYVFDQVNTNGVSSNHVWELAISWLPLFLPVLSPDLMNNLCNVAVGLIMKEELKSDMSVARMLLKNSFVSECRQLQTDLLTYIWNDAGSKLISMKRKHNDDERSLSHRLVWQNLAQNTSSWQKYSESKPELSGDCNNKMWKKFKKAAKEFSKQDDLNSHQKVAVNVDHGFQLVQVLCLFPLEDLEPGNQMRCFLGLMQLLAVLNVEKHGQKMRELHVLLCQSIISLLRKMPVSRILMFFEADVLLQKVFDILRKSDDAECQKWCLVLLDKIVYILIYDTPTLDKVAFFSEQLQNISCSVEVRVLQTLIRRLLSLSKRYLLLNSVQSFEACDQLLGTLVSMLSKNISYNSNLDRTLTWDCLSCILLYQCRPVPENFKTSTRKPEKYMRKHLAIVETLVLPTPLLDSTNTQSYFDLVGLICKNRPLFEKHLPEKFVLKVWKTVLSNITTISKDESRKNQTGLEDISLIIKSLNPKELKKALNKHCTCLSSVSTLELLKFLPLWITIINTDFGASTPKIITKGIASFLNLLLPLFVQLSKNNNNNKLNMKAILSILTFVADILQKGKVPLKHSQIIMCFQACSSLKISSAQIGDSVTLCNILTTIYKRLLNRAAKVILESVPAFLSCLSVCLVHLVRMGNQTNFPRYEESLKRSVVLCAQDFSKLLALTARHKTEFSKQAIFLISSYVVEVQDVTVHTLVKEQILLGIYKMLDICDENVVAMLQVMLPPGGREILRQMHEDFHRNYKYKGKV